MSNVGALSHVVTVPQGRDGPGIWGQTPEGFMDLINALISAGESQVVPTAASSNTAQNVSFWIDPRWSGNQPAIPIDKDVKTVVIPSASEGQEDLMSLVALLTGEEENGDFLRALTQYIQQNAAYTEHTAAEHQELDPQVAYHQVADQFIAAHHIVDTKREETRRNSDTREEKTGSLAKQLEDLIESLKLQGDQGLPPELAALQMLWGTPEPQGPAEEGEAVISGTHGLIEWDLSKPVAEVTKVPSSEQTLFIMPEKPEDKATMMKNPAEILKTPVSSVRPVNTSAEQAAQIVPVMAQPEVPVKENSDVFGTAQSKAPIVTQTETPPVLAIAEAPVRVQAGTPIDTHPSNPVVTGTPAERQVVENAEPNIQAVRTVHTVGSPIAEAVNTESAAPVPEAGITVSPEEAAAVEVSKTSHPDKPLLSYANVVARAVAGTMRWTAPTRKAAQSPETQPVAQVQSALEVRTTTAEVMTLPVEQNQPPEPPQTQTTLAAQATVADTEQTLIQNQTAETITAAESETVSEVGPAAKDTQIFPGQPEAQVKQTEPATGTAEPEEGKTELSDQADKTVRLERKSTIETLTTVEPTVQARRNRAREAISHTAASPKKETAAPADTYQSEDMRITSQSSAAPVQAADTSSPVPARQVLAKEIIAQIVQYSQQPRESTVLQMELHPKFLGKIEILLESSGGGITAKLKSDNGAVRSLLNENIAELRDTLRQAGINMKDVEITESKLHFGFSDRQYQRQDEARQARQGHKPVRIQSLAAVAAEETETVTAAYETGRVASTDTAFDYRA
ncbi:MAG: flagellar hook-length control protein FliK [Oscillospiraceae bacterium]|jgi:flagellar hook-length control protein FliK|nr:flagellar hook-length control protein FliK [Oscillospiraceae bacterium]